jgi:hypothetical protein
MSARKIGNAGLLQQPLAAPNRTTRLDLPAGALRLRKNGIEFRSDHSIPVWTEMTVAMEMPPEKKKLNLMGVVVACSGNAHAGYVVSMLFTNVSKQVQARLDSLVLSF